MTIDTPQGKLVLDFERWQKDMEYHEQKEKEYWKWVFSGQRTIDMFGVEGAKKVLKDQEERERKQREESI